MNRVYLPLLPLPVLAVIVAVSACSKAKNEEPSIHIIPPAVAMPWRTRISFAVQHMPMSLTPLAPLDLA